MLQAVIEQVNIDRISLFEREAGIIARVTDADGNPVGSAVGGMQMAQEKLHLVAIAASGVGQGVRRKYLDPFARRSSVAASQQRDTEAFGLQAPCEPDAEGCFSRSAPRQV